MWGPPSRVCCGQALSAKAFSRSDDDGLISVNHFPPVGKRQTPHWAREEGADVCAASSGNGHNGSQWGELMGGRKSQTVGSLLGSSFSDSEKGGGRSWLAGQLGLYPQGYPLATGWGRARMPWCLSFPFSLQTAPAGAPSSGGQCP